MEDLNNVVTPEDVVTVEPTETPEVIKEKVEEPKPDKNTLLRELSKEYGVNLFDAEGLAKFKEFTESQKSEQEKLQEQLKGYEEEKNRWQSEKLKYESKLKASELGISPDKLEDALKLAGNDPSKLTEVVQKYPIFKSKESVRIGVQDPLNSTPPTDLSEVEAYMAQDPLYSYYNKTKK